MSKCCVLVRLFIFVRAISNIRRTCVGSNDDAFADDLEDPDYVEEPVKEFEGKSYRPSLIRLNLVFRKHKIWPTYNELLHDVPFRMFFSSLGVTQVCLSHSLILSTLIPWQPQAKLLFWLHRLGASLSQNFQNSIFSCEFINGFETVLSWERHGYAPTLCICNGESALAYKDCRCAHHLAYVSCNHMSDLGRTWSRTHRLRAAIHLEAGCNRHQERTWDLCGIPESGLSMGPVWRTMSWTKLYILD